jgi:hypothetical protein
VWQIWGTCMYVHKPLLLLGECSSEKVFFREHSARFLAWILGFRGKRLLRTPSLIRKKHHPHCNRFTWWHDFTLSDAISLSVTQFHSQWCDFTLSDAIKL